MLIHVCDRCHEKIDEFRYDLDGFRVFREGGIIYEVGGKEFCSLHCQQQYLTDGLAELQLAASIKV